MMKVMTIVSNTEQKISKINIFEVLHSSSKSSKILILENKSPYGIRPRDTLSNYLSDNNLTNMHMEKVVLHSTTIHFK